MRLKQSMDKMLPAIESELKRQIDRLNHPRMSQFHDMLTYHMGWTGEGAGSEAAGKRIRPLLVLLVVEAEENKWLRAMPAAAAVELVHNFSLVHDDIQDHSEKRRGRPTTWKKWGAPMAINVGDALFVIANLSMMDLLKDYPAEIIFPAAKVLHDTCLDLTRGQFLDMSYETRSDLSLEDYWPMIQGKTSALLAASTQIGAMLSGAKEELIGKYRVFGESLGLAFQVQDDYLGIWGNEALTGKSAASDLVEGKNSLPVLYGLSQKGKFAQRWGRGKIPPEEVAYVAQLLTNEGAQDYITQEAKQLTAVALDALHKANPDDVANEALVELVNKLLGRAS